MEGVTVTWTQPVCNSCWFDREGERTPVRMREPELEFCCLCGQATHSGIYVRLNPMDVPYPKQEE
jgi:hypothetical protein